MKIIFIDLETFNPEPKAINNGAAKYSERAEIILISYAIGAEPARVVDVSNGEPMPEDLYAALSDKTGEYCALAHNSYFDRTMIARVYGGLGSQLRWIDTMIMAYSLSLPGSLADLCGVLKLPTDVAKDKDGKRLIRLFSMMNTARDGTPIRFDRRSHPADWYRFVNYARLDVESMREVWKRLPKFNNTRQFWDEFRLDQKINDRGMAIDLDLVHAAIEQCSSTKDDLDRRISEMTDGKITSIGQRAEILQFIRDRYAYNLPDLQMSTINNRIADPDTPEPVREILINRLSGAKTSIAKYKVLANATNADGRLRGCLQFCGASRTGRFSGRIFQPQNLPRGSLKPEEVEVAIDAFKCGIAGDLYEDLNSVASSCLRGAIIAPEGKKLVVADLSNIEGRVLAWAAGERWKLQAFREYDAGTGPDLYKKTYARTFGTTPEAVDKKQRQIGKVLELGMGYGGGASAFIAYGQGLNLDFSSVADNAERALDPAVLEKAAANYQFFIDQGRDLSHINKRWFIAIEAVKIAWRAANKEIVALWDRLAVAACSVLRGETRSQKIGPVVIDKDSGYLRVRLPSGRYMCYPAAIALTDRTLKYFGANQITKKWGYIETYGGKITENTIQAIARDVLVSSMQPAEDAGYKVVLSVHDELITETEDSPAYNEKGLAKIMSTAPVWAEGLPLSAAGFEGYRYRKD